MERNRRTITQWILLALVSAAFYFLLDYPIRATAAFQFPDWVGMKSFLPFCLGLFLGPVGTIGAAAGGVFSSLLLSTPPRVIVLECVLVLIVGFLTWLCWFAFNRDGNLRLESARKLGFYFVMTAALSVLCGLIAHAVMGGRSFAVTTIAFLVCGSLVSTVIVILVGGIFCFDPTPAPWCRIESDVLLRLPPEMAAPDEANEEIEMQAMRRKIPMKRVFEIENCLEEIYIRIRKERPEAEVFGRLNLGTTISMRLAFPGEKYNPFQVGKEENEEDLISLKLLRHRALRASYSYRNGENRIHVVV